MCPHEHASHLPDRAARAVKINGQWKAGHVVDDVIEAAGLIDTARHVATRDDDPSLLAPTGAGGGPTGSWSAGRCEALWSTGGRSPMFLHSDHDAVVTVLSLEAVSYAGGGETEGG